jgi:hypothetical protein
LCGILKINTRQMKKLTYILLIVMISLFSCFNEKREKKLIDNLIGVRWENSDLDFIGFNSTLIFLPIKDMYPTTCAFKYSIQSDTLIVINKTVNAYNIIDFKDSISYLKIKFATKDSIKLELLNDGAKELFHAFENFNFYNSNTIDRYSYYKEKDSSCLQQINQAKIEVKNEKFVLCIHPRWPFRQENEFVKLLERNGIKYKDLGPPSDVLPIARNCYRETMDYYIRKRFGKSFIDSLMNEADTLMVRNNRSTFIDYSACDERPHLPKSRPGYNDNMIAQVDLPVKKYIKEWKTSDGDDMFTVCHPFMDIGFHIDTTGRIDNFYLNFFNPELDWNKKYKDELFKLGVEKIKEDSIWIPGKILGIAVRTDNNVRVYFKRKNE